MPPAHHVAGAARNSLVCNAVLSDPLEPPHIDDNRLDSTKYRAMQGRFWHRRCPSPSWVSASAEDVRGPSTMEPDGKASSRDLAWRRPPQDGTRR